MINISRLLQSLDQDGDPSNGISISPTTLSLLGQQAFEFDLPVTEFQLQVNPFIENIFNRPIVDAGEAINHLHSSLNLEGRPGSIGSQDEIRLLVPGFVTVTPTNEPSEPLPPQLKSTATSRVEQFLMAAASSLTSHQMLLLASFVPHKLASATTAY